MKLKRRVLVTFWAGSRGEEWRFCEMLMSEFRDPDALKRTALRYAAEKFGHMDVDIAMLNAIEVTE